MQSYQIEIDSAARAASLPPPTMEETGWDILLALHSDARGEVSLERLSSLVSVHRMAMGRWLSWLEDQRLIMGEKDTITGDLRAALTAHGRDLLDRYLSAIRDLEAGAHH